MKLKAFRNPNKTGKNSPDYILLEEGLRVGAMWKNKDASGLINFSIIINEEPASGKEPAGQLTVR